MFVAFSLFSQCLKERYVASPSPSYHKKLWALNRCYVLGAIMSSLQLTIIINEYMGWGRFDRLISPIWCQN
ncbi:hypothetical protein HI914_00180 [Erysiphe necator]|nr:hypothetical protein HI914_00180 [Erysiphe necator]